MKTREFKIRTCFLNLYIPSLFWACYFDIIRGDSASKTKKTGNTRAEQSRIPLLGEPPETHKHEADQHTS